MSLLIIKDTVQQVASAITAALDLETEIVDENLMIIGGTGRYFEKIGSYEEDGVLDSNKTYSACLNTGQEYITLDPSSDTFYDAKEGELAEICCPVKNDNSTIGLIGLIAFTPEQRDFMIHKTSELIKFLRIMADLIAGKYALSQNNILLQNTISALLSDNAGQTSFGDMIGNSPAMQKVKQRAAQVAAGNSTILITGESGTGKGLLARSIHKESSRADKPFIAVNCAAIPETLLESELFGYKEGAFTGASKNGKVGKFQLADGGTLFLDEIGDMPMHLQVKLLTFLQDRQIDPIGSNKPIDLDVRVIAATNKNLEEMVKSNEFREDLYFRLNVIPIHIPPLRERLEDFEFLLAHAIRKFSNQLNKPIDSISPEALKALTSYQWPGNVREIENIIEYAVNMENSQQIQLSSLPDRVLHEISTSTFPSTGTLKERLSFSEKIILSDTLKQTGSSLEGKRKAAKILGISESTLYRRLRELDML